MEKNQIEIFWTETGKFYCIIKNYNHSLLQIADAIKYLLNLGIQVPKDANKVNIEVLAGTKYKGMHCIEFDAIIDPKATYGFLLNTDSTIFNDLVYP